MDDWDDGWGDDSWGGGWSGTPSAGEFPEHERNKSMFLFLKAKTNKTTCFFSLCRAGGWDEAGWGRMRSYFFETQVI